MTDPANTSNQNLAAKPGILHVESDPEHAAVEIEFDPSRLTDAQVRSLIRKHVTNVESALHQSTWELRSNACEACALKLEKRVARLPGVRRARATYLGRVLTVTFDPATAPDTDLETSVRQTGADIAPLTPRADRQPLLKRILSGDLNEELSCALGLLFLIAAAIVQKTAGTSPTTHTLYTLAYLFAGQEGVRSAIASLRERVLDVDVLMVLAALGAALIGAPFEGALLLFLFSFSNVLQRHAMDRTHRAIESLLTLRPTEAVVKRGTSTERIAVEKLDLNDIVIVKPGEQIPVDGILTEGHTTIDESSLTGESMPASKSPGAQLFAGTLNQSGGIELTVTRRADDSALARMVKLVAEAQAEKSTTQRFLETAEQYYAMGVILFTIGTFLVPWLFMAESFATAFYRAMTVMVVASPCALIISTPATVLSAIGGAARRGILIKGGSHLERATGIDIVAVDKTGTLTVGKPSLTHIVTPSGTHPLNQTLPENATSLLTSAAALEARSEHPLAHAITAAAHHHKLTLPPATNFQATPGKGARADVSGTTYLIGSERFFTEQQTTGLDQLAAAAHDLQHHGKTCVWLARQTNGSLEALAVLAMADTLRPEARDLTATLRKLGVKQVVMLTGDQQRVADAIAREAAIDHVHAGLLPEDKLTVIRELKQQGTVLMVGDGVNDAPALAIADVGVAMGAAGTDVAMETADIVLMGDRLENIPLLLSHTRRARRVLLQNLIFATTVIVVLVISALGFSLPLPLGVIGHEGSTVLVCLNGLRLLFVK